MFKIFASLMLLATLAVLTECGPPEMPNSPAFMKSCLDKNGLTFKDIQNKDLAGVEADKVDRKYKCFAACILEGSESLDDDGKIIVDKVMKPSAGLAIQKVEDCKANHDLTDDKCEYAFAITKCLKENH